MRLRKNTDDLLDDEIILLADCSDALAHPARIRLFRYIMACNKKLEPVCNKDLVAQFDYSQATISQHMNKLTASGLVEKKQKNRFTYYYVNIGQLMKYVNIAKKFE